MFCVQCGSQISDGDAFCTHCGAVVDPSPAAAGSQGHTTSLPVSTNASDSSTPEVAQPSPSSAIPVETRAPKSAHRGAILTIAVAAVVIALGVGALALHQLGVWGNPGSGDDAGQSAGGEGDVQASEGAAYSPSENASTDNDDDDADEDSEQDQYEPEYTAQAHAPRVIDDVWASSELATDSVNTSTYTAGNLIDGKLDKCWCEGVSGSGVGETVTFEFEEESEVSGLKIANGYQSSTDLYYANARPKSIEVFIDGKSIGVFSLEDNGCVWQTVDFGKTYEADSVKIEIRKVFEGSRHEDCCISEIEFI